MLLKAAQLNFPYPFVLQHGNENSILFTWFVPLKKYGGCSIAMFDCQRLYSYMYIYVLNAHIIYIYIQADVSHPEVFGWTLQIHPMRFKSVLVLRKRLPTKLTSRVFSLINYHVLKSSISQPFSYFTNHLVFNVSQGLINNTRTKVVPQVLQSSPLRLLICFIWITWRTVNQLICYSDLKYDLLHRRELRIIDLLRMIFRG